MEGKKFYKSKIVILGLLQIVGGFCEASYNFIEVGDYSIPSLWGALVWVVSGIGTIKLRLSSKTTIE